MFARTTKLAAPIAALLATSAGSAGLAADETPTPGAPGARLVAHETLSPTTDLTAVEIPVQAGAPSRPHRHAGSVFVYVLEGDVRSQINDEPAVVYHPGDSWFEPEGVVHTLVETAGDTETARVLVIFIAPTDAQLTRGVE